MRSRRHRQVALVLGVGLLTQIGQVESEQATAEDASTGSVRSEFTLASRTVRVTFAPALRADDPAHQTLLSSADGAADGPVRVAQLESNVALHVGGVELVGDSSSSSPRYDLWLERGGRDWHLRVGESARPGVSEPTTAQRTVPLSHTVRTAASPTFTAALVPTGKDAGQLLLQWGLDQWMVDVQFGDPPPPGERRAPGTGDSRTREDDTATISRAKTLEERNETGLVLPDGSRLSVLFWKELDVDGPDFPLIAAAGDGTVVPLTAGAVTRLKTEAPMQFGEVLVDTDNLAPGFAGAYGLWLKRAGPGWRLVFTHEPDVWGTQYDTAFDAAEIELAYSHDDTSARPFGVSVRPTGADRGRLVLQWGPHEWSADFVTAG